jgi:hypothetical protein
MLRFGVDAHRHSISDTTAPPQSTGYTMGIIRRFYYDPAGLAPLSLTTCP